MDDATNQKTYSVGELAEAVGISRRAIRYYVQQGVLPAPVGLGRGAHYTREHVDALTRVLALQQQGVQLAEMRESLDDQGVLPPPTPRAPRAEDAFAPPSDYAPPHWLHFEVEDGIEIHVRADRVPDLELEVVTHAAAFIRGSIRDPHAPRPPPRK